MKKILNVLAMAVTLSGGMTVLTNSAHADWEYVRTGVVCATSVEGLNELLYAHADYVIITLESGHKKVPAPFRIVNVSESANGSGFRHQCVVVETLNREFLRNSQ